MSVLAVFGYGLIGFGPLIVLFCVTIARKPHEIIILITSAFFWLMSLLATSVVWIIVPPLKYTPAFTLPFAVLFQEFFRWLIFRLLKKADKVLEVLSDDKKPRRKHRIAYVSGLGFGTIAAIVLFSNALRESGGPGVAGINDPTDSSNKQYYVLTMALSANIMVFLHVTWSMIWFDSFHSLHAVGFSSRSSVLSWIKVAIVVLSHLFVSCMSLVSSPHSPLYFLLAAHITAGLLGLFALYLAGFQPILVSKLFKGGR